MVKNDKKELVQTRLPMKIRVCIDYQKLNAATCKDHFPLPFIGQMLERLAGHEYYCFLDGYSGYNQIPIAPEDQEKTTFTCSFGTFAYRRMPFGLYNTPATFQRYMLSLFSDMVKNFSKFLWMISLYTVIPLTVPASSKAGFTKMHGEKLDSQLGEVSFYG